MTGAVILALLPVVLLIALGMGLRRGGFLDRAFWPGPSGSPISSCCRACSSTVSPPRSSTRSPWPISP